MNILSIIIVGLLLVLCFVFFIRSRVILLMSVGLKISFFLFIIMSLTAIFIPEIYNFLADFTLKQVGTYESIQNLDDKFILNTVSESSKDLWENFMDLLVVKRKKILRIQREKEKVRGSLKRICIQL